MDDKKHPKYDGKAFGGKAFREALGVLAPLLTGVKFLGLLRGALTSGVFEVARTSSTPVQISEALGMPEDLVIDLCHAFDAHGVFVRENGAYRLQDHWAVLTDPDSHKPLGTLLDFAFAESRVLEHIGSGESNYWETDPSDRLALARGATSDPTSAHTPDVVRSTFREALPEIHEVLSAGGACLELGCGIGGGLIARLRAFPKTTAVGVELAADLIEEARRSVATLGLGDRVTLHHGDAGRYEPQQAFDLVFWSQFYFPADSRVPTLRVAHRALKSGGFLMAPFLPHATVVEDGLHSEDGRKFTLGRAYLRSWGIPILSAQNLKDEMTEAGFDSPQLIKRAIGHYMVARKPR